MNLYLVVGWSPVPGDRAFVEGACVPDACATLRQTLALDDPDFQPEPETAWRAISMSPTSGPVCVIVWKD